MLILAAICYLIIVTGIGYAVNALLAPIFGKWWRLFVAPGVIVHEVAHAIMCILMGARVMEINFWKPSGGHVIHTEPKFHIIGPVLISFAPTVVMTVALVMLAPSLSSQLIDLPWAHTLPTSTGELIGGYFASLFAALGSFNWLTPAPWLLTYTMLNVAVTISPSTKDLQNAQWAFVGLLIALGLLAHFFAISLPIDLLWPAAATSLIFLGIALLAALVVRIIWNMFIQRKTQP